MAITPSFIGGRRDPLATRDMNESDIANEALNYSNSTMHMIRSKNAAIGLCRALRNFLEDPSSTTVATSIAAAKNAYEASYGTMLRSASALIKFALLEAQAALEELSQYEDLATPVKEQCNVIAEKALTCVKATGLLQD